MGLDVFDSDVAAEGLAELKHAIGFGGQTGHHNPGVVDALFDEVADLDLGGVAACLEPLTFGRSGKRFELGTGGMLGVAKSDMSTASSALCQPLNQPRAPLHAPPFFSVLFLEEGVVSRGRLPSGGVCRRWRRIRRSCRSGGRQGSHLRWASGSERGGARLGCRGIGRSYGLRTAGGSE